MNIQIRPVEREDLNELVAIYNQAITEGQKTADLVPVSERDRLPWFESHVDRRYPILVATGGGAVVGYLTLSPYRPGRQALRHTAEVSYYVHSDCFRQGIASALMRHAISACPSLQIKTLFAILLETNHGSIKLLEGFGFEVWGRLPRVADFDGVEVGHLYYGKRV